ncbi:RNA 3'-terminal phosphate cyclase domain-containing protein [Tirmania nivea]|nr:RNA 3'-terminal phosphate cyclase domain-containing protein [Tirmania nivea]
MPRAAPPPRPIPGDRLEGGGQLLRNALALSILTRTPVQLTAIRGNRAGGGGLKPQHVSCVAALAMLSGASVGRDPHTDMFALRRGLHEIIFRPGMGADWSSGMWGVRTRGRIAPPRTGIARAEEAGEAEEGGRVVEIDIGSNGAVTLVLQAVLPVVLFGAYQYPDPAPAPPADGAKHTIICITGGTNVCFSPSVEYISQILFPTLTRHLRLPHLSLTLLRRGWAGSSELGKIRVAVGELNPGEGVRGFRIEPDGEVGERVGKVCVTIVVPTEREVAVWSEVARGMVRAAGVRRWRVPPRRQEAEEDVVEGLAEVKICEEEHQEEDDGAEVDVEITDMSMATLGPGGARASGVGGASAQSYYVLVHTVSHPSGWRMGYDVLYTAQRSAKLPGLVGALDSKRASCGKKKGRHSKPPHAPAPPPDTDAQPAGESADPELTESRLLARRLLSRSLAKLATQWAQGEVIDEFLRDQLVLYQALCTGESFISGGQGEAGKLGGEEDTGGGEEEGEEWGGGGLHAQTARWIARELGGVEWVGGAKEGTVGVGLKAGEEWEGGWEERMRRWKEEVLN